MLERGKILQQLLVLSLSTSLFRVLPASGSELSSSQSPNLFLVLLVHLLTFSHLPSCQLLLHLVLWFLVHLASHIPVLLMLPFLNQLLVQQHRDVSKRKRWNQLSHVYLTRARFVGGQWLVMATCNSLAIDMPSWAWTNPPGCVAAAEETGGSMKKAGRHLNFQSNQKN